MNKNSNLGLQSQYNWIMQSWGFVSSGDSQLFHKTPLRREESPTMIIHFFKYCIFMSRYFTQYYKYIAFRGGIVQNFRLEHIYSFLRYVIKQQQKKRFGF